MRTSAAGLVHSLSIFVIHVKDYINCVLGCLVDIKRCRSSGKLERNGSECLVIIINSLLGKNMKRCL